MLLYEHPLSSSAQKPKIALHEKGGAFDLELPEGFGTRRTGTVNVLDWDCDAA